MVGIAIGFMGGGAVFKTWATGHFSVGQINAIIDTALYFPFLFLAIFNIPQYAGAKYKKRYLFIALAIGFGLLTTRWVLHLNGFLQYPLHAWQSTRFLVIELAINIFLATVIDVKLYLKNISGE